MPHPMGRLCAVACRRWTRPLPTVTGAECDAVSRRRAARTRFRTGRRSPRWRDSATRRGRRSAVAATGRRARATSSSSPRASLPNSQAVGSASSAPRSRGSRRRRHRRRRRARPRHARARPRSRGRRRPRRAGGRAIRSSRARPWGCTRSTVRPVRTTASAPAASAARMIVPRLPGSRTSSQIATSRGDAANTSRTEVGDCRATATMPCGVTVSAIASRRASVVNTTSSPALARGVAQIGVALHRGRRREHLDDRVGAVGERLARGLRALDAGTARSPGGHCAWSASRRRARAANADSRAHDQHRAAASARRSSRQREGAPSRRRTPLNADAGTTRSSAR